MFQDILSIPQVASVCPPNELETFESQQVASDCMWSDPAKGNQVKTESNAYRTAGTGTGDGGGANRE